jgi:hypothetical protein
MDNADPRLESRPDPIYHPVRGETSSAVNETPFTQNIGQARIFRAMLDNALSRNDDRALFNLQPKVHPKGW